MKTIKELVKGKVNFEFYRAGELYYSCSEDRDFIFPVPINDCGEASFLKEDKAILFMRYIRKFMNEINNS